MGEIAERLTKMSAYEAEREGIGLLADSLAPIMNPEINVLNATQAAAFFALAQLKRDDERSRAEGA